MSLFSYKHEYAYDIWNFELKNRQYKTFLYNFVSAVILFLLCYNVLLFNS